MPRRLSLALLAAAAALVFALPGGARPAQNVLTATVGPGFSISLVDESGNLVTHLDPGTYTITVKDLSAEHNFDLTGPGVAVLLPCCCHQVLPKSRSRGLPFMTVASSSIASFCSFDSERGTSTDSR